MGYCCGYISGNMNLVSSRRLGCEATAINEWTLNVPVTASGVEIIWFFKATNASIFSEITLLRNETTGVLTDEGQYKIIVQSADGSVIVNGTIPCNAQTIVENDEEEVKARRVNTKSELTALKDAGLLVNPCIYYVVSENKHYYADSNNNFVDSTAFSGFGQYKDDEQARANGLSTGDVYEASNETNLPAGAYVLRVVRD